MPGGPGFHSLIGYVRATFLVALVDAVGIGTGLAIMGVPLALPLASLVFLGAFIPLVGAVLAGFLAVVVALLAKGLVYALITLGLDHRRAAAGGPRAAAAGDGPRGVDPSAGGGAGDRGGGVLAGHRRRAAGGADGRVPQQRGARAGGQTTRTPRKTRQEARRTSQVIEAEADDVEHGYVERADYAARGLRGAADPARSLPPPRRGGVLAFCRSAFAVRSSFSVAAGSLAGF